MHQLTQKIPLTKWRASLHMQILRNAVYNSTEGTWSLQSSRAGSAALPRRPASAAPRSAASGQRRASNLLLEMQLDIPERKAFDYSSLQFIL